MTTNFAQNQLASTAALATPPEGFSAAYQLPPSQSQAQSLPEVSEQSQSELTFEQKMANYYADCKYRIKKCWNPSTRVGSLRIDTVFLIHRNGDVSHIRITRSSGSKTDDQMAVQAIKRALPLARMPVGSADFIEVNFVFEINFGSNRDPFDTNTQSLTPPRRKFMPLGQSSASK